MKKQNWWDLRVYEPRFLEGMGLNHLPSSSRHKVYFLVGQTQCFDTGEPVQTSGLHYKNYLQQRVGINL